MILLLLILIILYFGNTLLPSSSQVIYGGDLLTQFYYWKGYLAENVKSGIIPFWNPYLFSGTPFLAHPGTSFFYPGTLLFILLPLNFAFSWNYFLHAIIGGIGVIYLVKRYTFDRIAVLLSACLFVLSGYFAARIYAGHVDLYTTAVWIPWVFSSFQKYLESGKLKKLWLPTIFITLEILAGYQAYVLFTFELLFSYTIYVLIRDKLIKNRKKLVKKLLFSSLPIVFAVLISAVQWLGTWELSKLSIRGRGLPYELASWGSLPISSLKLFIQPLNRDELNKISFNLGGGLLPNPFDHFIGSFPIILIAGYILLVILSKIFRLRITKIKVNKDFWFFLFMSLFFLWISFANYVSPNLHGLFYNIIPFYRFIRIPLQHLIIPVVLVPLMTGLIMADMKNKFLKILLTLLFIMELIIFDRPYIFLTKLPNLSYNLRLVNYLKENLKEEKLLPHYRVISPVLNSLDLNAAMKYNFYTTSGYDPVILDNYYSYIDLVNGSAKSSILSYNVEIPPLKIEPKSLKALNIGYILKEKETVNDLFTSSATYQKVLEDSDWTLYKNTYNLSPYTLIVESADGKECLKDIINEVKILSRRINRVELKVTNTCSSILSSSDVNYPGWSAEVDGKQADIIPNNLAFRSVSLSAGTHIVNFYYKPVIYYLGGGISILGLLSMFIVMRLTEK